MGITAQKLNELNLVDRVVTEPLGGAHRDFDCIANSLKFALVEDLKKLRDMPIEEVVLKRQKKIRQIGEFKKN